MTNISTRTLSQYLQYWIEFDSLVTAGHIEGELRLEHVFEGNEKIEKDERPVDLFIY